MELKQGKALEQNDLDAICKAKQVLIAMMRLTISGAWHLAS
jgi:hypothetical protein